MARQKTHFLMPDLVPAPLWGRSAYNMFGGRSIWRKQIRGDALAEANNRCHVCGASEGRLFCHERWQYDDKKATATLTGFEIHCGNCDLVAHPGRAMSIGYGEVMIAHLCTLTGWKPKKAVAAVKQAMDTWSVRSGKNWRIIVAPALLKKYPELAALPRYVPPPPNY
jgi:hypothetical protein